MPRLAPCHHHSTSASRTQGVLELCPCMRIYSLSDARASSICSKARLRSLVQLPSSLMKAMSMNSFRLSLTWMFPTIVLSTSSSYSDSRVPCHTGTRISFEESTAWERFMFREPPMILSQHADSQSQTGSPATTKTSVSSRKYWRSLLATLTSGQEIQRTTTDRTYIRNVITASMPEDVIQLSDLKHWVCLGKLLFELNR
jgi:hypothetical protein